MEFSPQQVRRATFTTVKKGYDPSEVDSFKESVASSIEAAQSQAMAMEARARAAVAKLQELAAAPDAGREHAVETAEVGETSAAVKVSASDTETISRTLLLAQRTADATIADAKAEAETLTGGARTEAAGILDGARSMAGKLIEEAKADARREAEADRVAAEGEVQALLARRDFLLSDVNHLEEYINAQRERLRDAAVSLQDIVERVPGGLGEMRRPLLSASAELDGAPSSSMVAAAEPETDDAPSFSGAYDDADDDTDSTPAGTPSAEPVWAVVDETDAAAEDLAGLDDDEIDAR
jgi:DivIVA domain-containing protein